MNSVKKSQFVQESLENAVKQLFGKVEKMNATEFIKGKYRRAIMRATRMLENGVVPTPINDWEWLVPSENEDGVYYLVNPQKKECDCPSEQVCKHRALVAMWEMIAD